MAESGYPYSGLIGGHVLSGGVSRRASVFTIYSFVSVRSIEFTDTVDDNVQGAYQKSVEIIRPQRALNQEVPEMKKLGRIIR